MDSHEIQMLQQGIQTAIADGMRDGFEAMEKPTPVTVTLPKPIELRDFFAGCALAGLTSHVEGSIEMDCEAAYKAADLMLMERQGITAQDIAETMPPKPEEA